MINRAGIDSPESGATPVAFAPRDVAVESMVHTTEAAWAVLPTKKIQAAHRNPREVRVTMDIESISKFVQNDNVEPSGIPEGSKPLNCSNGVWRF
jgi:hypothetical protein